MPRVAYRPLSDAVSRGDAKKLARLAMHDPVAARHWKPIMDAAFAGNVSCIDILVKYGADVNVRAGTGAKHTPLTRLCQYHRTIPKHDGHPAALRALLAYGADPRIPGGPLALTPLSYAAIGPLEELVGILTPEMEPRDVHTAAVLYDITRLSQLAAQRVLHTKDVESRTPLHYVCMSGLYKSHGMQAAIDCVDFLLAQGIEIDAAQPIAEGETVFHATALWYAVSWQGNVEMTKYLLAHGASPNPAVFSSLFEGNIEICRLLDDNGADWNQQFDGATPLIDLMKWRKSKLVPWLLERGVDTSVKDHNGLTALDYARKRKVHADVIELLIENGAKSGSA